VFDGIVSERRAAKGRPILARGHPEHNILQQRLKKTSERLPNESDFS